MAQALLHVCVVISATQDNLGPSEKRGIMPIFVSSWSTDDFRKPFEGDSSIDFFGFPVKVIEDESLDEGTLLFVSGWPADDFGKPLEGDDLLEWIKTHVVKMVNIGRKTDRFDLVDIAGAEGEK